MDTIFTWTLAMLMCAPRLLGLHMALPMFSSSVLPGRVRSGLSLSLTMFLMPLVLSQGYAPANAFEFGAIAVKEFFLGFAFGFPISLITWAAQSAGDLISFQSGASMATFFDPASHEEVTPTGSLLRRYAEVLFFVSGGYALMLTALFESYKLWPVGRFIPALGMEGAHFFADILGKYFAATCLLAFPALACMFLITICLGLISRYLPQLNVFFLAMPIQCLAAVLILILSFPVYAHVFKGQFANFDAGLKALHRVLTP